MNRAYKASPSKVSVIQLMYASYQILFSVSLTILFFIRDHIDHIKCAFFLDAKFELHGHY